MRFVLLLMLFADPATHVRPNGMFCEIVRFYIAQYGEAAALEWAKKHKWSKARIAEATACRLQ